MWIKYTHTPINCKCLRKRIRYAMKHGARVLDVNLSQYDKTFLPRCIFTCRSLEELKLKMGEAPYREIEHEGLMLPDIIRLPSLKKLDLSDVEVDTSSLKQFIDGSPGLEEVLLSHCAQHLQHVESNMLKRLEIHDFFDRGNGGLTIAAPHLTHFECSGWPLEEIYWQKRPSLESAHIDTWCSGRTFDGQSDLIDIVLHAKRLALCGSDIKAMLEKELPTCSLFDNLVILEIGGWYLTNDLYVVVRFLQLSPRLEKLTLKQRELYYKAKKEKKTSSMPIAGMTFKCPLLETVIIQCSKDDVEIEKTVAAVVALGIGLEKIQVIFYEDIERAERRGVSLEELKEQDALDKMLEEDRERAKASNARSDENDDDDGDEMEDEEYYSDEEDSRDYAEYGSGEDMDDADSEMDDEDDKDSEMDGEDDEDSETDDEDDEDSEMDYEDDEDSEMDDEDDDDDM